jgi:hypothetical protein
VLLRPNVAPPVETPEVPETTIGRFQHLAQSSLKAPL